MSSHPYSLRSRLNTQSPSLRTTPSASPTIPKAGVGLARRPRTDYNLQLQRVIGTTTSSPNGLACCPTTNSYAYCAGAVAVLSKLSPDGTPIHRYFKARPTAPSLNPPTSHYETALASTPTKRRASSFTPRKRLDDYNNGSVGRDWSDESGAQTWTARERIKTVACVSLSRDGQFLVVGEAGYNPRVLLFSTADDASCEVPTSIVTDHTYGLRCVAFSSDMRYLATLGDYKDGFLFIWSFVSRTGQLTLHSANKCTANICDMVWCGNSLVTVGTRSIRVWSVRDAAKQSPSRRPRYRPSETPPSSPGPAPLPGRSVLLGAMVDCTFTCVVSIDESNVVMGTETGHICLVDVAQNVLELKILKKIDMAVSSVAFVPAQRRLLVGTSRGVQREDFDALCASETAISMKSLRQKAPRLSIRRSLGLLNETETSVVAIGTLSGDVITLDNNGSLQIQKIGPAEQNETSPTFAAHKSVILGVQTLPESAGRGNFFTYSKNGEIKFWNSHGVLLKEEYLALDPTENEDGGCENEVTQMRYLSSHDYFVAADRFGVLKLIKNHDWETEHATRAHSAEVTSIDILDSASLVATCSRDRMTQLFRLEGGVFELLQTMDDHVGSVSQVLFVKEGDKLLSCSTDRSLVIRERVLQEDGGSRPLAYLTTKVLSLKASPVSMTMVAENTLAVSTLDRCVTKVDVLAGGLLESSKIGDPETDDKVFLNSLICTPATDGSDAQKLLIGYSSMDKAIRVYSEKQMSLLVRESAHTEGVSDLALLEQSAHPVPGSQCMIVSTGLDGTIMLWNITKMAGALLTPGISQDQSIGLGLGLVSEEAEVTKKGPASLPPMRKVLSKIEIADLTRAVGRSSPSSPRSLSPIRLKRKTSRLALATSIEDVQETPSKIPDPLPATAKSPIPAGGEPQRSPSPVGRGVSRLKSQRSATDLGRDIEGKRTALERSPSPPPVPLPSTPKHRQKANNARLRRAPSVPSDLRSHAAAQGRRPSMSQASEFGSLAMATDQASRMLKIYRKKLVNSKDTVDLNDLAAEVSRLLKAINERKDRPVAAPKQEVEVEPATTNKSDNLKVVTERDVDQLAVLLEGSAMTDSPTERRGLAAAPG